MTRRSLPLLAAALLAGPALAQDEGLYPDATAPDASFLRVYVPAGETVAVDGETLQPGDTGLTPYVEVALGPVLVDVAGEETEVEIQPNTHYSFVVSADGGELLTDGVTGSPAQADLLVLNLTAVPAVDLFVPSADAVAVEGVAAGMGGAVALRAPLTLDLEFREGADVLAQVTGVELVRSGGTTVLLTGESGAYEAVAAPNTYAD